MNPLCVRLYCALLNHWAVVLLLWLSLKLLINYDDHCREDNIWNPYCVQISVLTFNSLVKFLGGLKDGTCPILPPPEICVSDVDECFIDWDCVGNRKCCSNGCYTVCAPPKKIQAVGQLVGSAAGTMTYQEAGQDLEILELQKLSYSLLHKPSGM